MTKDEFAKIKIDDRITIDLTKYKLQSIDGKVIDKGDNWVRVYDVMANGYYRCTEWNYTWITSWTAQSKDESELQAKINELEAKIKALEAKIEALKILRNKFVADFEKEIDR